MAEFIENASGMEKFLNELQTKVVSSVEDKAKQLVPVKKGVLRDSIKSVKVAKDSWKVEADVDYATYVELGTSKSRAQPYLRPALLKLNGKIKI